jgi:hypothetical protein
MQTRFGFGTAWFSQPFFLEEHRDVPYARAPGVARLEPRAKKLVRQENSTHACCISDKMPDQRPGELRFDERQNLQRERPIRQRREEKRAAA